MQKIAGLSLTLTILTTALWASEPSIAFTPCELLSSKLVETVLPGASAGMTSHAGVSLIAGVDSYQCVYTNPAGDLLSVILNVTNTPELYTEIKPSSAVHENRQPIKVGNEGWMIVTPDEVKIKTTQSYTVIDVELMATDAAGKSTQMVDLAKAVVTKLK